MLIVLDFLVLDFNNFFLLLLHKFVIALLYLASEEKSQIFGWQELMIWIFSVCRLLRAKIRTWSLAENAAVSRGPQLWVSSKVRVADPDPH